MKNFNHNDSVEVILDNLANKLFEKIVSIESNQKEVEDLAKAITNLGKENIDCLLNSKKRILSKKGDNCSITDVINNADSNDLELFKEEKETLEKTIEKIKYTINFMKKLDEKIVIYLDSIKDNHKNRFDEFQENILFPIRQHIMDLYQTSAICMHNKLAYSLVINNMSLEDQLQETKKIKM